MHSEPEPSGTELAQRAESTALAEANPTLTGGVGLFDHSDRDPFPGWAGIITGIGALVLTAVFAFALFQMNPALASGKAGGTPNQLGAPAGAAGGALTPGSPAAMGAQIIATKPCTGCHTIPGIPGATGTVGPNLGGVASRTKIAGGAVTNSGPDDLKKWIMDPAADKPGTAMPKVPLTDDELNYIVAFLETLK
jgi:cytochrome c1